MALEMKRMIAYYLDPMACQPCDDLKEIVNMKVCIFSYFNIRIEEH